MPQIIRQHIGGEDVKAVSARELYLGLGLMANKWSRWYQTNIIENEFFKQHTDFIELPFVGSEHGVFAKDFAITIEFAKHIAMMAKTEKAHAYRNYFIECEKVAKGEASTMEQPKSTPRIGESTLTRNSTKISNLF